MTTRIGELEAKLAGLRQAIDEERKQQAINNSLRRIVRKVGETLLAEAKNENLEVGDLDGKTIRCSLHSRSGSLNLELLSQTEHSLVQIAMLTMKVQ